jgi:hypothetical protein
MDSYRHEPHGRTDVTIFEFGTVTARAGAKATRFFKLSVGQRVFGLTDWLRDGTLAEAGAYVIGTGRSADRRTALDFGAQEFVDLDSDILEDVGVVDPGKRSAALVRAGGMLVTIAGPPGARPADGLAIDFVVEADRGH